MKKGNFEVSVRFKKGAPAYASYIWSWLGDYLEYEKFDRTKEEAYSSMMNIINNLKFTERKKIFTGEDLPKEIEDGVLRIWNRPRTEIIMEIEVTPQD